MVDPIRVEDPNIEGSDRIRICNTAQMVDPIRVEDQNIDGSDRIRICNTATATFA